MPARLLIPLLAALALLAPATAARAAAYAPPAGKVYAGVSSGLEPEFRLFQRQVGAHPAVFQFFTSFNSKPYYMFRTATALGARTALHVTTERPGGPVLSPRAIARGHGDAYLVRLNGAIADTRQPAYVRLMSEMNNHGNAYSAFDARGRSRGASHTTRMFRQAWRRSALILRGGPVIWIDAALARLGLPPVRTSAAVLPRPKVALQWVPMTAGSPDIRANRPRAYWPGAAYVDWVGTDFYSLFPNFAGLDRFYREFPGKPFVFGEWAMWGRDSPAFVHRFFNWIERRPRVRMALYYQGKPADAPWRLARHPRSRAAIARRLNARRYLEWAPEHAPR